MLTGEGGHHPESREHSVGDLCGFKNRTVHLLDGEATNEYSSIGCCDGALLSADILPDLDRVEHAILFRGRDWYGQCRLLSPTLSWLQWVEES